MLSGRIARLPDPRERDTDRHRTLTTRHVGALSRRSLYALPLLVVNSLFTDGAAISLSVAIGPPWASMLHWLLLAGCRIAVDVMTRPVAHQYTARLFKLTYQLSALHKAISFIS